MSTEAARDRIELAVVMPVYNEEECIAQVLESWLGVLRAEKVKFRMIVLNDGSTDGTEKTLALFADGQSVDVVNKPNAGHGPTILAGYAMAVEVADWVFQCDSDNEISPSHFTDLWLRKREFDALFGRRSLKEQPILRRFISFFARATVRLLYGKGVVDVNVPFRLIRADLLKRILGGIPEGTLAPNIMISGALNRERLRIYNHRVQWKFRRTGTVSIVRWKLWKFALRAFWQTLRWRPRIGGPER